MFQLDAAGQALYESGALCPVGDGFHRRFGRAADGTITGHGALQPLAVVPQQAMAVQLAFVTLALTAAIKEVQEAVERVEEKVALLRDLLEANRDGEIIGANRALRRRAEHVGFDGTMSDTDWHSIEDRGVEVEQQIERLRSFIRKRLAAAEDEGRKISGRLEAVDHARDVSETPPCSWSPRRRSMRLDRSSTNTSTRTPTSWSACGRSSPSGSTSKPSRWCTSSRRV